MRPPLLPSGLRALCSHWHDGPEAVEAGVGPDAGAYLLAVWLPETVPLPPALCQPERDHIAGGWLVYAGSARGPGGLRARLRRHMRRDKGCRWHVDWLTTAPGARVWAAAVPAGDECALACAVRGLPGATTPVPGFGSSDCRTCPSHLIRLPEDVALAARDGPGGSPL
ncbi:DUF123 domain-containing protein [Roseospira marina]|uniref:DUF123 domain-containing protein n=1 Tax=Roseospira marina TaxID=140057 RepID=UPI001843C8F3|nr:DUF123 domain-containing protein [Roseospira marina]MBB4316069.1 Uri superfamily endonuclease [Roseospira marina]MBB5089213.1 Uri superfamily endonuclease [Roseospira marina]